MIGEWLKTIGE